MEDLETISELSGIEVKTQDDALRTLIWAIRNGLTTARKAIPAFHWALDNLPKEESDD